MIRGLLNLMTASLRRRINWQAVTNKQKVNK
jgi:hypothetical protein